MQKYVIALYIRLSIEDYKYDKLQTRSCVIGDACFSFVLLQQRVNIIRNRQVYPFLI